MKEQMKSNSKKGEKYALKSKTPKIIMKKKMKKKMKIKDIYLDP